MARPHGQARYLAFYAQDRRGMHDRCHQLFPIFMSRISACIFAWDATDVALLRQAKRQILISQGFPTMPDEECEQTV